MRVDEYVLFLSFIIAFGVVRVAQRDYARVHSGVRKGIWHLNHCLDAESSNMMILEWKGKYSSLCYGKKC